MTGIPDLLYTQKFSVRCIDEDFWGKLEEKKNLRKKKKHLDNTTGMYYDYIAR